MGDDGAGQRQILYRALSCWVLTRRVELQAVNDFADIVPRNPNVEDQLTALDDDGKVG